MELIPLFRNPKTYEKGCSHKYAGDTKWLQILNSLLMLSYNWCYKKMTIASTFLWMHHDFERCTGFPSYSLFVDPLHGEIQTKWPAIGNCLGEYPFYLHI